MVDSAGQRVRQECDAALTGGGRAPRGGWGGGGWGAGRYLNDAMQMEPQRVQGLQGPSHQDANWNENAKANSHENAVHLCQSIHSVLCQTGVCPLHTYTPQSPKTASVGSLPYCNLFTSADRAVFLAEEGDFSSAFHLQ